MQFANTLTDKERRVAAVAKNSYIDSVPTEPEWTNWVMRPRQKSKEIGPSMRFNSHFQAERLMENLKNRTQMFFTKEQVTGVQNRIDFGCNKNIEAFKKTG